MPAIELDLNGDGCWPDLAWLRRIELAGPDAPPIRLAMLAGGMASGAPSVTFRLDLPDGTVVLAETSLAALVAAAATLQEAAAGWRIT